MKRIIRVFPSRTSYTPEDEYVFIGMPPFIIPEHDEVHISCTFTRNYITTNQGIVASLRHGQRAERFQKSVRKADCCRL